MGIGSRADFALRLRQVWRNRWFRRGSWFAGVVAGGLLVALSMGAATTAHHISLPAANGHAAAPHWNQASIQYFGRDLAALRQADPVIDLDIDVTRSSRTTAAVKGTGRIRVGDETLRLALTPGQTLAVGTARGVEVYAGGLNLSVTTAAGEVPGIVAVLYQPETRQAMANVTVGTAGQEMVLFFGRPFLTKEEMEALGK